MRMNSSIRTLMVLVVVWAFVLGMAVGPQPASAQFPGGTLGDLVKIFGIGWVVNQFSGEIDSFINSALAQREARIDGATKVVPILSVGTGTTIGAAQVQGERSEIRRVDAVTQLELRVGGFRGQALIPVTSGATAVPGVGLSANISFPL